MATATYSASLRTRKINSSSNAKTSAAAQEYYDPSYNYVGIICFSSMNLTGKVITGISLTVHSQQSGPGAGHTKTVYWKKSRYQEVSKPGITGANYAGDALGVFTGSFYNNTTTNALTGAVLANTAEYIAQGNNTFTIYNPSPYQTEQGYSSNYLVWDSVIMTVTYQESASNPSVSATNIQMGTAVTIYTNRASASATHTLTYAIGSSTGTIATGVGASTSWTPPLSLASLIPNAVSCICTIICTTYYGSTATGSRTCALTLNVPASVVPNISSVSFSEATTGIAEQFSGYVQTKSRLSVSIAAAGTLGSAISSYRTTLDGSTYSAASFTTNALMTSGSLAMTVMVTDSRGRTASTTKTISVLAYTAPSITSLKAERCSNDGSAPQTDGARVRLSTAGSVSAVNHHNIISCKVYYKLSSATAWTQTALLTVDNYIVSATNLLLSPAFDVLKSYDIKVSLSDFFTVVEQIVSIGTKQVMMDFLQDGSGIAFGKVAEESGYAEFGWPVKLPAALPIAQGGTGQTTAAAARNALGLGNTSGALPIANGGTGKTTVAAARNALGLGNTGGAVPVANGGTGAATAADARTNLGITPANIGAAASSHNHAAGNITSGTIAAARLPFRIQYGSTIVSGVSWTTVSLSGFTNKPIIVVSFANNATTSGIHVLKTQNESASGFQVCMAGSSGSGSRTVNWIAIGTG